MNHQKFNLFNASVELHDRIVRQITNQLNEEITKAFVRIIRGTDGEYQDAKLTTENVISPVFEDTTQRTVLQVFFTTEGGRSFSKKAIINVRSSCVGIIKIEVEYDG